MKDPVRTLLWIADDLDRRGYPFTGALRQVAREYVSPTPKDPGGCGRCGDPIVQPHTGRPRKFCTACSPPRKSPRKRHPAS